MIDDLLQYRDDGKVTKITNQLPQKSKPEPIEFSVPTAQLEDGEIRFSFDDNG